jgi:hypothetical protein
MPCSHGLIFFDEKLQVFCMILLEMQQVSHVPGNHSISAMLISAVPSNRVTSTGEIAKESAQAGISTRNSLGTDINMMYTV